MKPAAICLIVLVFAASPASAQSTVVGRTVDRTSQAGLAGVRVAALTAQGREAASAVSDSTGSFLLPLPAGKYTLRATIIGYAAAQSRSFELEADERLEVRLQLAIQPIEIDPLVVVSTRTRVGRLAPYYDRLDRRGSNLQGRFLTRAQIDSVDLPGITAHMESVGLPMQMNRRGEKWPLGIGRCRMRVFLDNAEITGLVIDELVRPSEVEGVEIYRSAFEAPPEYSSRANTCGVVLIWTRSDRRNTVPLWKGMLAAAGFIGAALIVRRVWLH